MPVNGFGPIVTGGAPAGTGLAQASANVFQDFTSTLKDLAFFNLTQKKQEEAAARDAALREQLLRMQTEAAAAQNAQDIAGRQALEGTRFGNESKLADQRYARDIELEKIRAANERAIAGIRTKADRGFRDERDVRAQLALYTGPENLKFIPNSKITEALKLQSLAPLQEYVDKFSKLDSFSKIFDAEGKIPRKLARDLGYTPEEKKSLEKIYLISDPIKQADAIQQFESAKANTSAVAAPQEPSFLSTVSDAFHSIFNPPPVVSPTARLAPPPVLPNLQPTQLPIQPQPSLAGILQSIWNPTQQP